MGIFKKSVDTLLELKKEHDRKKDIQAIEYFEPFSVPEFGYPSIESQDFEKCKNEARRNDPGIGPRYSKRSNFR